MNDSDFGLTAAIWTGDLDAALSIGDRVETGTWFMNRCDYLDPALAWVGVKDSGRGCTLSVVGYEHLTRPKSFHLQALSQRVRDDHARRPTGTIRPRFTSARAASRNCRRPARRSACAGRCSSPIRVSRRCRWCTRPSPGAARRGSTARSSPTCRPIRSRPTSTGGVEAYRRGAHDGVIAFGGGSALDAGKVIAFMVGQTRPIWDFEDRGDWYTRVNVEGIAPVVAVPTTAGTGSEVGRAARDHRPARPHQEDHLPPEDAARRS